MNSGFGTLTNGNITAGEVDTFDFTATAGTFVWFDSQGTVATQLVATLRDASNQIAFQSTDMTDRAPVLLSRSGNYTLSIQGDLPASIGNYSFRLLDMNNQATLVTPGAPIASSIATVGEVDLYRFPAEAGQRLMIDSLLGSPELRYHLIAPSGEIVVNNGDTRVDTGTVIPNETGTYFLSVFAAGAQTGNYDLRVRIALQTMTASALDSPMTGAISVPGESDVFTFAANSGQRVIFDTRLNTPEVRYHLISPTGNFVIVNGDTRSDTNAFFLEETGTFQVVVFQPGDRTGAYDFRIASSTVTTTDSALDTPMTGAISEAGEVDIFTFAANAGQRILFDTQLNTPEVRYHLISPTGDFVIVNGDTRSDTNAFFLEETGTFQVVVFQPGDRTGAYDFRFATGSVTTNDSALDTPMTGAISVPGEVDIFTFAANAGRRILFDTQLNTPEVRYHLISPTGNFVIVNGDTRSDTNAFFLEETGTFQVVVFQPGDRTGAYDFRFATGTVTTTDSALDTPMTGAISEAGEVDIFTFAANAGQRVLFDSQLNTPEVRYNLISPTGDFVLVNGDTRLDTNAFFLEETGTYQVVVFQPIDRIGAYDFRIGTSTVTTTPAALDTPLTGVIGFPGEVDRFTFTANIGDRVIVDSRRNSPELRYHLLSPTGSFVIVNGDSRFDSATLSLSETGTYQMLVFQSGDRVGEYDLRVVNVSSPTDLPLNSVVNGSLLPGRGLTAYRFLAAANQRFFFDSQGTPNSGRWTIVDAANLTLSNVGLGQDFIFTPAVDGLYTLLLSGDTDTGFDYHFRASTPSVNTVPLVFNAVTSGQLTAPGEQDIYTLNGTNGTRLFFDTQQDDRANINFRIVSPSGVVVLQKNTDDEDYPPFTLRETGQFRLIVEAVGDLTGDYRFRVLDAINPQAITLGTPDIGTLDPGLESDIFRLDGIAGQRVRFDFTTVGNYGWALDGPGDFCVACNIVPGMDIPVTLPSTGPYILSIRGKSNTAAADYAFTATDISDAPVSASGFGTLHTGTVVSGTPQDFAYTASAGTTVYLDLTASVPSVSVELRDPTNQLVFSASHTSDLGPTVLPRSGNYTIRVSGNGNFSFRLSSTTDATPIELDRMINGTFDVAFETDVYRLQGVAGQRVYFDLAGDQVGGDIRSRLVSPDGITLFDLATNIGTGPITLPRTGMYLLTMGRQAEIGNYRFRLMNVLSQPELAPDVVTDGAVSAGTEADIYRINGFAGQPLAFDFTSPTFGARSKLFTPSGVQVVDQNSSVDFVHNATVTGEYVLVVDGNSPTPELYTVRLSARTTETIAIAPLTSVPPADGGAERWTYGVDSQPTSMIDELGRQTIYELDPLTGNRLSATRVIGAVGGGDDLVTTYTYTSEALLDTITDPLGRITDNDYDSQQRLVTVTYAKGTADEAAIHYEYSAAGNATAFVDELGHRTEYQYDALNRLTRVTQPDPDGASPLTAPVFSFTYDAVGNLLTETDARGNVTRHEYDSRNRLTRTVDAVGNASLYEYDARGNQTAMLDRLGRRTTYEYDPRNRVTRMTDPLGNRTSYEYDAEDNLLAISDALGNRTSYEYDARSRQTATTDALGNSERWQYDPVDNVVGFTDRAGRESTYAYDDVDRLVRRTDPLGGVKQLAYDKASNVVSRTDELGRVTQSAYNARNWLIESDHDNRYAFDHDNRWGRSRLTGGGSTGGLFSDALLRD